LAKECIERCPKILETGQQAWFWLAIGTIDNVVPPSILLGGVGRNLRAADRILRALTPTMGMLNGAQVPAYDGEAIDRILTLCDRSYSCSGPVQGKVPRLLEFSRARRLMGRDHTGLVDGTVCPVEQGF
jgi:hypothetical protein